MPKSDASSDSSNVSSGALPSRVRAGRLKGVFKSRGGKYRAQIQIDGTQHYLGSFSTEEEAGIAYDAFALCHIGPAARTNFRHAHSNTIQSAAALILPDITSPTASRDIIESKDAINPSAAVNPSKARVYSSRKRLLSSVSSEYLNIDEEALFRRVIDSRGRGTEIDRVDDTPAGPPTQPDVVVSYDIASLPLDASSPAANMPPALLHTLDWRDQMYYWSGTLAIDWREGEERSGSKEVSWWWRGSWLGSFAGRPSTEEIRAASQSFEYLLEPSADDGTAGDDSPPLSGLFSGHFMMDSDDSGRPEMFAESFFVRFSAAAEGDPVMDVEGEGDSDFGRFLLEGSLDILSGELEMCRKYIRNPEAV